ncbi:MAG: ABC transporter permease, partial [Blastocatellia bacterium]
MRQDIRFAFRMISSHRWFSAAIVVTLGLGIGLNTMVFTLVNAALFKPVPLPNGERLVAITSQDLSQNNQQMGVSYPDFRDYQAQASSFQALEAAARESAVLSERGNPPQPYSMGRVSSGMFEMLQMRPILGRGFLPGDDKPGAEAVLLLGHTVWKDRYGSSGEVVGRQVRVNEKPATIIGVMPEGFKFPHEEDLWMPLPPTTELEDRRHRPLELFGILKPGESIDRASADLGAIAHRLAEDHPESNKDTGALVQTFHERYNGGNIKRVFLLMLIAVGFVLLTACANVANMMLSRTLARRREMSIRAALGASSWQLIRQLLIESVALSALGGVLGLGLCEVGIRWFDSVTQNVGKPYWVQFTMDYRVFAYFAVLCLFSVLLFGLAPALRSSRQDMNDALKDGVRSIGTRRGGRLSGMLVIGQFALTLVLLTGAGIFVRGFLESLSVNKAVPASELLTAAVRLPKGRYPSPDARQHFFDQLLPTLARIPGATHAAIVSNPPATWAPGRHIEIEGGPMIDPAHRPSASFLVQSPGYFAAIN